MPPARAPEQRGNEPSEGLPVGVQVALRTLAGSKITDAVEQLYKVVLPDSVRRTNAADRLESLGHEITGHIKAIDADRRYLAAEAVASALVYLVATRKLPDELAARITLRAGGLLEDCPRAHATWRRLARVLAPLLASTLDEVTQFVQAVRDAPRYTGSNAVEVCGCRISPATASALKRAQSLGYQAFLSLDIMYLPAVAAWSRQPRLLAQLQRRHELMVPLRKLSGSACAASLWLETLLTTPIDRECLIAVPELGELHRLTLTGVVDVGQLSVLLSAKMRVPLWRLGVTEFASPAAVATMSGSGPQSLADVDWPVPFQLYPWAQPGSGRAGAFRPLQTWLSSTIVGPLDEGCSPLPMHAPLGRLPLTDGMVVLVMCGPGTVVARKDMPRLAISRQFHGLAASISDRHCVEPASMQPWATALLADAMDVVGSSIKVAQQPADASTVCQGFSRSRNT